MSGTPLTVAQYNVLSQRCAKPDERGFPHVDAQYLEEGARAAKIAAQILSVAPDVVCMQEFDDTLDGRVSALAAALHARYHLITEYNATAHGLCVALRRDSPWELEGHEFGKLEGLGPLARPKRYLAVHLVHRGTWQTVSVVTTHLKAGGDNAATRAVQMAKLLCALGAIKRANPKSGLVVCGDLNCEPTECAYQMLLQADLGLHSVYADEEAGGDHFTTRKMRAQEKCVCEDYMLSGVERVRVVEKRTLPGRDTIPYPYMPNAEHGSDHLMLWCKFVVVSRK